MTNFYIELDNKFDELIVNSEEKKTSLKKNDLIELKAFILHIYNTKNKAENEYIRQSFQQIEFKI